jgi:hypothetical protein
MGTRARIAVENPDKSYTSIYTHWDGYPDSHGTTLMEHYTDPAKIAELMALGDLSSLGASIGTKHSFGARTDGECTAYGRDRGETGIDAVTSATYADLAKLTQDCGGEWLYVFRDGQWLCAESGGSMFGMPSTKQPETIHPISYWLEKSAVPD